MKRSETDKMIEIILQILSRGNSVEIKQRKDDIIILEVKRTIKQSV